MIHNKKLSAFTLIELVVVVAVLSLVASLLLPAFSLVRGKARQTTCISNLKQIGMGVSLYTQDNDSYYPYAVDPIDLMMEIEWTNNFPQFGSDMPKLGMVHEILKPYVGSPTLFKCAADTGFDKPDYMPVHVNARPSSFEKINTSYFYRTEIAAHKANDSSIEFPTQINLIYEVVGHWHGTLLPIAGRYNTLFCDGHVKSLTLDQSRKMWDIPLSSGLSAPSSY